jgi:hypothetical protein
LQAIDFTPHNLSSEGEYYSRKTVLEWMREYCIRIPGIEPYQGLMIGRHAYNVTFDNGLRTLSSYDHCKPTHWIISIPSSGDHSRTGHVGIYNPKDWDHVHRILLSLIITNSTDTNFWQGILEKISLKHARADLELSDLLKRAA